MKSDSPLRRLLVHTSHYSLANVLTTAAGLITFPLLTRVFSVADYGMMSLIGVTITTCVAFGKLGMQHAIVRYHSEVVSGKSRFSQSELYSTVLIGMLAAGIAVTILLFVGTLIAPARWFGEPAVRGFLQLASILAFVQMMESGLVNITRAEQETGRLTRYLVIKKYLSLALVLSAVLLIEPSLRAYYIACVLAEGTAVVSLATVMFRGPDRPRPRAAAFSFRLYRQILGFGIPMMIGQELSGTILSVGDRYVIHGLIGEVPLGLYGAAFTLCLYVQSIFIESVNQAIMPIYMRIWDKDGPQQTSAFISRSLRTYLLLCVPIVAGIAAVGGELLPLLASEKYTEAAVVLPWIMSGMAIEGTSIMSGAGLFIQRKTRAIMTIVVCSAAFNIALNFVLIPRLGILGSAIATLASYALSALAMSMSGRRFLAFSWPWATLIRACFAAALMYLAVAHLIPGGRFLAVIVRTLLGASIYTGIMAIIDPAARDLARGVLRNVQSFIFRKSES